MPRAGGNSSALIIARLPGTEGYSDFVHNQIGRYWKKKIQMSDRKRRIDQLEAAFSDIMRDMPIKDRLVAGKFISLRSKMSFDTGLRIGIQAFAHEHDKAIFDEAESNEKKRLKQERSLSPGAKAKQDSSGRRGAKERVRDGDAWGRGSGL